MCILYLIWKQSRSKAREVIRFCSSEAHFVSVNAHLINAIERFTLKKPAKEKDESNYYFVRPQPQALLNEKNEKNEANGWRTRKSE